MELHHNIASMIVEEADGIFGMVAEKRLGNGKSGRLGGGELQELIGPHGMVEVHPVDPWYIERVEENMEGGTIFFEESRYECGIEGRRHLEVPQLPVPYAFNFTGIDYPVATLQLVLRPGAVEAVTEAVFGAEFIRIETEALISKCFQLLLYTVYRKCVLCVRDAEYHGEIGE